MTFLILKVFVNSNGKTIDPREFLLFNCSNLGNNMFFKLYITLSIFFSFILTINALADENVEMIYKSIPIEASKDQVWKAVTTAQGLASWWGVGVRLEPFIGGEFYEPWGDDQLATGVVVDVSLEQSIKFTWREKYFSDEQSTICAFSMSESDGKTIFRMQHFGWESFKNEQRRKELINGFNQGWDVLLPRLKKHLESN